MHTDLLRAMSLESRDRRRFMTTLTAAGVALAAAPRARGAAGPDVELRLRAELTRTPILPGASTPTIRFAGEVVRGRSDALRDVGGYLGPTLDLRRGERVRIHFDNQLPEASVIHWHGMLVPESADGHPRLAVAAGESTTVEFTVDNPAGTYFYHPHPHGRTGFQVYYGLAGLLIVREPIEQEIGLPAQPFELPLVIQDRRIAPDNSFVYGASMMDAMDGMLGDTVLVNGRADAFLKVAPRAYRLRIVNASNARIYRIAWSDGEPLHVIGAGSGLFSAAEGLQTRASVALAPAERIEVIEDFSRRRPGSEIALVSRAFRAGGGMMGGMMGGMGGGMMRSSRGSRQGQELQIARFAIANEAAARGAAFRLPEVRTSTPQRAAQRHTELGFMHMRGLLNGRSFQMDHVADDEQLRRGEPVVWTFANPASMMMAMPHPMHIHGVQFRVIERNGRSGMRELAGDTVDTGLRDTVLVLPGEEVKVAFTPTESGLFLYHCHNLEHEDGGMMRNLRFVS